MSFDYADYDYDYEPIPAPTKRWKPRLVVTEYHHPISQPDTIRAYLKQGREWIDHDGVVHKIKDMEKEYLFNILAWLDKNYDRVYFTYNFIGNTMDDPTEAPLFVRIRREYMKYLPK